MTSNVISFPVRGQHRIKAIASRLRQLDLTDYDAPQEMRVMRACRGMYPDCSVEAVRAYLDATDEPEQSQGKATRTSTSVTEPCRQPALPWRCGRPWQGVVRPPRLAPSMLQPCSRRREKAWHEMIRAVLRGGPLSGEPPKFKAAANMRSSR